MAIEQTKTGYKSFNISKGSNRLLESAFETFLRPPNAGNAMSYRYKIEPPVIIVDENLNQLKQNFEIYSLIGVSVKLAENGYRALPESFAPSELPEFVARELGWWEYMDGLAFKNVGWTPEGQGLEGIVERFIKFAQFVDYNIPHRDYAITDNSGNKAILHVTETGCSATYVSVP